MVHQKILVIEDDDDIQELILHTMTKEGFRVTIAPSGEEGLKKLRKEPFDCIVLDLMLPGIDGLELCRQLKMNNSTVRIPVVMVTAKGAESDIVAGLELGADDYIVKPFSPRILIARVRATLRRKSRETYDESSAVAVGTITIDPGKHEVMCNGKKSELTHMEFLVLHLLMSQPGYVFTRNQIIDSVRSDNYPVTDRSVDVLIVGLRKKLGDAARSIETVRGVGYRFGGA